MRSLQCTDQFWRVVRILYVCFLFPFDILRVVHPGGGHSLTRVFSYHCCECDNYDICAECATIGLYCLNDDHYWVEREIDNDELFEADDRISPNAARALGSAKKYPSKFQPPQSTDTPKSLFADKHRFIRKSNPREILLYTDGSCLGNGQDHPRAGCAVVHRPTVFSQTGSLAYEGSVGFRLENQGPAGEIYKQTSNRAELRAVIGALQFRDWSIDCNRSWRSIVIATDSEYVAINATERIQRWEAAGWRLASKHGNPAAVMNQDLWKLFLKEVRQLQGDGVNVAFWRIPRDWNRTADEIAKVVATKREVLRFRVPVPTGPISVGSRPYLHDGSF
jgi:ribonuclease HI